MTGPTDEESCEIMDRMLERRREGEAETSAITYQDALAVLRRDRQTSRPFLTLGAHVGGAGDPSGSLAAPT